MSVLPSSTRTGLPDSAFAAVWTDADGNKQRKLPYKHADGSIDLSHLHNALSRLSQTDMPESVKGTARRKLEAAKEKYMTKSIWAQMADVFKRKAAEPDEDDQMKAFHGKLGKAIEAYGDGAGLPSDHPLHALKALHKEIGDVMAGCSTQKSADETVPVETPAPVEEPVIPPVEEPAPAPVEEPAPSAEDVEKAAKVVELSKALDVAKAELAAEREKADMKEMIDLLKSLNRVSINPEADAPIFKSLKGQNEPAYNRVIELLKSADAVAALTDAITKTVGSDQGGDGKTNDAWTQIEREAAELQKSDEKITKAQAITVVMAKRPELVRKHYEEQGA